MIEVIRCPVLATSCSTSSELALLQHGKTWKIAHGGGEVSVFSSTIQKHAQSIFQRKPPNSDNKGRRYEKHVRGLILCKHVFRWGDHAARVKKNISSH